MYLALKSFQELREPGAMLVIPQIFLIGLIVLIFSLIVLHNSNGRRRGIVGFAVLGLISHFVLAGGNTYLILFFQAVLLLALLRKTKWLEELTKTECWIYLVLILFFFKIVSDSNPFSTCITSGYTETITWYSLPYFLYLLFKLYVLAVLIKIPVVLVYNHARLSRKMYISGLFQSTFPQFIQLISLLLIFYFFLAGWQAGNLRTSIKNSLEQIPDLSVDPSIQYYKFHSEDDDFSIIIENYEPLFSSRHLPEKGVLELKRHDRILSSNAESADFFIFSKSSKADSNFIHLIKIDSHLLKLFSKKLRFIAGTSMSAYTLSPEEWISYIYRLDFWQSDPHIKIFPFCFVPTKSTSPLSISLETEQSDSRRIKKTEIDFAFLGQQDFIFGRVFLPLQDLNSSPNKYLVFDIVLNIRPEFLWSGLVPIILFMAVIYVLLNSFIIRQVVKFGSQINEMIVQKFNQLKSGIQEISTGNLDYKIKLEGEDEFVELANHFNEMSWRLKQNIAEVLEKDRLQYELQIAREVQLSLLPRKLPEIPGYQISTSLKTATEVGGDFYDIFPLENGHFLFTIGDVSGKGSSAAFYMAQCMSLVRFSRQFTSDPNEISSRLNNYFAASVTDRRIFVTAIVGRLEIDSNTLHFVRAGHTEPIFIPGDKTKEIRFLKTKGLGIGLTKDPQLFEKSLKSFQISFEAGDTLLFYTDGVIEAARQHPASNGPDDTKMQIYGENRLKNLLNRIREKNAKEMILEIELDIESFYAEHPRVDDHTLFIIQRTGSHFS